MWTWLAANAEEADTSKAVERIEVAIFFMTLSSSVVRGPSCDAGLPCEQELPCRHGELPSADRALPHRESKSPDASIGNGRLGAGVSGVDSRPHNDSGLRPG